MGRLDDFAREVVFGNKRGRDIVQKIYHGNTRMGLCCYPASPKKWGMTGVCFFMGITLYAVGMHLAYVNVAPQRARIKARSDYVKEKLSRKYGYTFK